MLRQKTLLGETYVELTPGTPGAKKLPEGGRLADAQVSDSVQLDEIFDSLDPETRKAFRGWQQDLAKGIEGRGRDFNDALGTLPGLRRRRLRRARACSTRRSRRCSGWSRTRA